MSSLVLFKDFVCLAVIVWSRWISLAELVESASRSLFDFGDWKQPNKNLIVSMSIKQEFRQSKRRKGKRDPKFVSIQLKGLWRSFKGVLMKFSFIFLEYRNTVLLRGVCGWSENNQAKSFFNTSKIDTSSRTLSGAGQCPASLQWAPKFKILPRNLWSDKVRYDRTMSGFWILAQRLDSWENSINISTPSTTLLSWLSNFPIERVLLLHSKSVH
jgi:hypothetical protein